MTDQATKDLVKRLRELLGPDVSWADRASNKVLVSRKFLDGVADTIERLTASAPVDGDEIVANAPEKLKALGARLADLLDDDHWNNIEPLLLDIGRMFAARPTAPVDMDLRKLVDLIRTLLDNDPMELAADGGITVLDVWRKEAERVLALLPARTPEPDADGDVIGRAAEIAAKALRPLLYPHKIGELSAGNGNNVKRHAEAVIEALAAANLLRAPAVDDERPKCSLCGLEDGACICRHIPKSAPSDVEAAREACANELRKKISTIIHSMRIGRSSDDIAHEVMEALPIKWRCDRISGHDCAWPECKCGPLPPAPARGGEAKPCTCHPDDNPPNPCMKQYTYSQCVALADPDFLRHLVDVVFVYETKTWPDHESLSDKLIARAFTTFKDKKADLTAPLSPRPASKEAGE